MRDLFSDPLPAPGVPPPQKDESKSLLQGNEKLAKEFVRWCCSFGDDFRNSPDLTNLRFWLQKNKLKLKDRDEQEILGAARPAILKQIEQLIRKSEVAT